jgi:hypothetical protein
MSTRQETNMNRQLIVRMEDRTYAAAQNGAHARGLPMAAYVRSLIHEAYDKTREKLDPAGQELFDEGKLDRVGYGMACAKHRARKTLNGEKHLQALAS